MQQALEAADQPEQPAVQQPAVQPPASTGSWWPSSFWVKKAAAEQSPAITPAVIKASKHSKTKSGEFELQQLSTVKVEASTD